MEKKSLVANTAYLTVASIAQKAVAFLYFAFVARFIGTGDTGIYFLALSISTMIAVFGDIGVTSVLVREIARSAEEPKKWIRAVMGVKAIAVPITVAVLFFGLPIANAIWAAFGGHLAFSQEIIGLVRLTTLVVIADSLSLAFFGVLRGARNLSAESLGIFIGQTLTTLAGVALILTGNATLESLILALMAGSVWNMLFSGALVIRRYGVDSLVPDFVMARKMARLAVAFFVAAIFVKILASVDSVFLQLFHGEETVGYYAVAYKLTYAFQFIPLVFVAALYPEMSALANDDERLVRTTEKAFWYMGLVAFPIVLGIFSVADQIIALFYSEAFLPAVLPLQIMIFVLLFVFFDFPLGSLLNARHRQRQKTLTTILTVIVNIICNVLLIPKFGAVGASIAGIVSFWFMFTADYLFASRVVPLRFWVFGELFVRIGVPSIVMAIVVLLVKHAVPIYVSVPIGAITFLIGIVLSGGLKKADLVRYVK